jgi:aspartate carbamoyltransferase catalytic subunit
MGGKMKKDIVSIRDFTKDEIIKVLEDAKKIDNMNINDRLKLLHGKKLGTLFFEPSTRTRLSFESSMLGLGGSVIGFADANTSSSKKGESLTDTIKTVERYCDVIAMRHHLEGAARIASEAAIIPIINGGDGANQHPTQTFLDLYTIKKIKSNIDGLTIGFVGDLKFGRTVHSLAIALAHFNVKIYFIAPDSLKMPKQFLDEIKDKIEFVETDDLKSAMPHLDVMYMTRVQKERFHDLAEYEKVKGVYVINKRSMKNAKEDLIVMHPLPRVDEIDYDLDDTPYAVYFDQLANGVPVRQALLCKVLGVM